MRKRITSHDVARRAGVSRVTVSMILNRAPGASFSLETRERVLKAAEELGYRPHAAGRMLVSGTTETIGLVVRHSELLRFDGFVPQVLNAIARVSQREGYRVLLEIMHDSSGRDTYVDLVRGHQIDGLLIIDPPTEDRQLRALIEDRFPLVLMGAIGHPGEHSINVPTDVAMRLAVDHLVGLGHRRFAHITYSARGYLGTDLRLDSLRGALGRRGLELPETAIAEGAFSAESGFIAVKSLLASGAPMPTAILVGNDTVALGVLAGIADAGLRVPEDIAVVGFDDLPIAAYAQPSLTTIGHPAAAEGTIATEMLISILRGEPIENANVLAPVELIVRRSCGGSPGIIRP